MYYISFYIRIFWYLLAIFMSVIILSHSYFRFIHSVMRICSNYLLICAIEVLNYYIIIIIMFLKTGMDPLCNFSSLSLFTEILKNSLMINGRVKRTVLRTDIYFTKTMQFNITIETFNQVNVVQICCVLPISSLIYSWQ